MSTQTPKMGDNVKVVACIEGFSDLYMGSEGVVLEVWSDRFDVEFDGNGEEIIFYPGELEVIK